MNFCSVLLWAGILPCRVVAPGDGEFFHLSISMQGGDTFLLGQELFVIVRTANPHRKTLSYSPDRLYSIVRGTSIELRRGDSLVKPSSMVTDGPTGKPEVCQLRGGEYMDGFIPLSEEYDRLSTGTYRALVHLELIAGALSSTAGKATSNEITFEVVPWAEEAARKKPFRHGVLEGFAGVVKTWGGDVLAAWGPSTGGWDDVVPLGRDLPLDGLLWDADRYACIAALPGPLGRKTTVLVAHRGRSVVESLELRGGTDRAELAAFPGSRIHVPLQSKEEAGVRQTRVATSGLMGLVCGVVVGGVIVWLLTRRKRRAA